jgi:hypothetical protein
MNEGLSINGILASAGWDHLEPSWIDYSWYICMAIDKLSINDLLIDNIQGAPTPEDTPNNKPITPQHPDLTCTPDLTMTKAHSLVVGVENVGGKAYGKATTLYIKH